MASDQITGLQDQVWLKDVSEKLDQKMRFVLRKAQDVNYIPYSIPDFVKQAIAEFTTGTRDIETGWDQYLAELDSMGLQQLIAVAQETYNRVK